MGAKQTGNRKYLFFHLACGVMLSITINACRYATVSGPDPDATAVDLLSPAVGNVPAADEKTLPPLLTAEETPDEHLNAAYLALVAGDYTAAVSEIEIASIYKPYFTNPETIYLSGLLYADPDSPTADIEMAYELLQGLWQTFPESERALEGRIISDLLLQILFEESQQADLEKGITELEKQLEKEQQKVKMLTRIIEKMKEIDLEIAPTD